MVCGHLDRNLLARLVAALVSDQPANLVTPATPLPGPRCDCDEHPARRRAPMPGEMFSTGALPGLPATASPGTASPASPGTAATGPVPPGRTATGLPSAGPVPPGLAATLPSTTALPPASLARLHDTLLRYTLSLLSGPAGLASYLRTQLTSGFFPSPSLPLDLGEPTEQVPPHLRRAVIKRDRHCAFPGCSAPPVRCHVHHLIPRSKGGVTRLDNLALLCHFHHLIAVHVRREVLLIRAEVRDLRRRPCRSRAA